MWSFRLVSNNITRTVGLALLMAATPALPQDYLSPLEPERVWLAAHNIAREEVGLAPLQWNQSLARDAEDWANTLAERRVFQHAPYDVRKGQGENLWQGTRDRYSPWQMISAFVAEKRDFRPGTFPNVSYTGRWSDVGHYTQIIWPETQEVGCATARNRSDEVLVCRYWPAGNVMGTRLDPLNRRSSR
jgi:uncharacterized protein YkwD